MVSEVVLVLWHIMKLKIRTMTKRPQHRHISALANKLGPVYNYWQECYCYLNLLFLTQTILLTPELFCSPLSVVGFFCL